jgi:hypothetical protein
LPKNALTGKNSPPIVPPIKSNILSINTKDWAAFLQLEYKDYGDLIKELDIKL